MKPSIKLQSLAISNFRAIEDFALPRDGLGWNEHMPDVLLLGGENGSGKTTVLEVIYSGLNAALIRHWRLINSPWYSFEDQAFMHLQFDITNDEDTQSLTMIGRGENSTSVLPSRKKNEPATELIRFKSKGNGITENLSEKLIKALIKKTDKPTPYPTSALGAGILYIPSERSLDIPPESLKTPGQIEPHNAFFWRWERPKEWKDSLEALLFSTRWADLNAREAGQPATLFASYQAAFEHFFADKKLTWTPKGELVVTTAGGAQHPLDALSSGEKQVLLLCAEIHRRWRPGSLVLIDEPELHLHTRWLTELWRFLVKTQKERGGQLIVATQSNHLFRIADPDCKAIIGRSSL